MPVLSRALSRAWLADSLRQLFAPQAEDPVLLSPMAKLQTSSKPSHFVGSEVSYTPTLQLGTKSCSLATVSSVVNNGWCREPICPILAAFLLTSALK